MAGLFSPPAAQARLHAANHQAHLAAVNRRGVLHRRPWVLGRPLWPAAGQDPSAAAGSDGDQNEPWRNTKYGSDLPGVPSDPYPEPSELPPETMEKLAAFAAARQRAEAQAASRPR